ncbi:hypothetical protein B0H13DRAFT_1927089 [Mycena leptocephala]|nr:hypothetical protein B0H13DRAFT_1927089 [Mycena leptocephala]
MHKVESRAKKTIQDWRESLLWIEYGSVRTGAAIKGEINKNNPRVNANHLQLHLVYHTAGASQFCGLGGVEGYEWNFVLCAQYIYICVSRSSIVQELCGVESSKFRFRGWMDAIEVPVHMRKLEYVDGARKNPESTARIAGGGPTDTSTATKAAGSEPGEERKNGGSTCCSCACRLGRDRQKGKDRSEITPSAPNNTPTTATHSSRPAATLRVVSGANELSGTITLPFAPELEPDADADPDRAEANEEGVNEAKERAVTEGTYHMTTHAAQTREVGGVAGTPNTIVLPVTVVLEDLVPLWAELEAN